MQRHRLKGGHKVGMNPNIASNNVYSGSSITPDPVYNHQSNIQNNDYTTTDSAFDSSWGWNTVADSAPQSDSPDAPNVQLQNEEICDNDIHQNIAQHQQPTNMNFSQVQQGDDSGWNNEGNWEVWDSEDKTEKQKPFSDHQQNAHATHPIPIQSNNAVPTNQLNIISISNRYEQEPTRLENNKFNSDHLYNPQSLMAQDVSLNDTLHQGYAKIEDCSNSKIHVGFDNNYMNRNSTHEKLTEDNREKNFHDPSNSADNQKRVINFETDSHQANCREIETLISYNQYEQEFTASEEVPEVTDSINVQSESEMISINQNQQSEIHEQRSGIFSQNASNFSLPDTNGQENFQSMNLRIESINTSSNASKEQLLVNAFISSNDKLGHGDGEQQQESRTPEVIDEGLYQYRDNRSNSQWEQQRKLSTENNPAHISAIETTMERQVYYTSLDDDRKDDQNIQNIDAIEIMEDMQSHIGTGTLGSSDASNPEHKFLVLIDTETALPDDSGEINSAGVIDFKTLDQELQGIFSSSHEGPHSFSLDSHMLKNDVPVTKMSTLPSKHNSNTGDLSGDPNSLNEKFLEDSDHDNRHKKFDIPSVAEESKNLNYFGHSSANHENIKIESTLSKDEIIDNSNKVSSLVEARPMKSSPQSTDFCNPNERPNNFDTNLVSDINLQHEDPRRLSSESLQLSQPLQPTFSVSRNSSRSSSNKSDSLNRNDKEKDFQDKTSTDQCLSETDSVSSYPDGRNIHQHSLKMSGSISTFHARKGSPFQPPPKKLQPLSLHETKDPKLSMENSLLKYPEPPDQSVKLCVAISSAQQLNAEPLLKDTISTDILCPVVVESSLHSTEMERPQKLLQLANFDDKEFLNQQLQVLSRQDNQSISEKITQSQTYSSSPQVGALDLSQMNNVKIEKSTNDYPDFHRMIPGESSKGATSSTASSYVPNIVVPAMPTERVVTGNANPQPISTARIKREPKEVRSPPDGPDTARRPLNHGVPVVRPPIRSETIGSEDVPAHSVPHTDRREIGDSRNKERDAWDRSNFHQDHHYVNRKTERSQFRDGSPPHNRHMYDDDHLRHRDRRNRYKDSDEAEDYDGRERYAVMKRRDRAYKDEMDRYGEKYNRHRSSRREYDDDQDGYYEERSDRSRPSSSSSNYGNVDDQSQGFYRQPRRKQESRSRERKRNLRDSEYRRRDPKVDPYSRGGYRYPEQYGASRDNYDPHFAYYNQKLWEQYYYHQYHYGMNSYGDDKASIRSGRSSVNEGTKKSSLSSGDISAIHSVTDETGSEVNQRLTPLFFNGPHLTARFTSGGKLLRVVPTDPKEGEKPYVQIRNVQQMLDTDRIFIERIQKMKNFPGPLTAKETHKDIVIKFCLEKSRKSAEDKNLYDRESVALFWEYLSLLVKQNGKVCGVDLANLLLKDKEISLPSVVAASEPARVSNSDDNSPQDEGIDVNIPEQAEQIQTFTQYLCLGRKREAVDYAIKEGLWGYAMTLASKMDTSIQARVTAAFMNSIPRKDVLHTLIQHLSCKKPDVTKNYSMDRWGDWRQHLAIMVSNPTNQPQRDQSSTIALGDILAANGRIHAAHLCYLAAEAEWGTYANKDSKIVLIGSSHLQPFLTFSSEEAMHCTEIYEFAKSQGDSQFLNHFQFYKLIYALRLTECGFSNDALKYCEMISQAIMNNVQAFDIDFVSRVNDLATQLKYHDIYYQLGEGEIYEMNDPEWIKNLQSLLYNLQYEASCRATTEKSLQEQVVTLKEEPSHSLASAVVQDQYYPDTLHPCHDTNSINQVESITHEPQVNVNNVPEDIVDHQRIVSEISSPDRTIDHVPDTALKREPSITSPQPALIESEEILMSQYQPQWKPDPQPQEANAPQPTPWDPELSHPASNASYQNQPNIKSDLNQSNAHQWGHANDIKEPQSSLKEAPEVFQPPVEPTEEERQYWAMMSGKEAASDNPPEVHAQENSSQKAVNDTTSEKMDDKKAGFFGSISGWFNKNNNQAILPDDKNPKIIFDKERNKWVNIDGDDPDTAPISLPPTAATGPPTTFRGGMLKSRYVDPVGNKDRAKPSGPAMMSFMPNNPPVLSPQPMEPTSFGNQESASNISLSAIPQQDTATEDAENVTMMPPDGSQGQPMFFNPSQMKQQTSSVPQQPKRSGPSRRVFNSPR